MNSTPEADPVVVGVDGSEQALSAVRWAAHEASLRGTWLHIVHAWVWPLLRVSLGPAPGAPEGAGLRAQAERVLAVAAGTAKAVAAELSVESSLVVGDPVSALLRTSEGAVQLVVGNRGLGGFTGLLVGSTSVALSSRATCPVVVVRGADRGSGTVAVGVDGTPHGVAALASATVEAGLRRSTLLLVHAWTFPLGHDQWDMGSSVDVEAAGKASGRAVLDAAREQVAREDPTLEVNTVLGDRSAAGELVAASERSVLVVVGSHSAGPLAGLLLNSTAHALIHHAACPVLVHRGETTGCP